MAIQSLEKSKIKIVLLEGIHQQAVQTLAEQGYENVVQFPKSLVGEELAAAISDAHFVGIRSRTKLDQRVLEQAAKLVAIGCFCIGTDQVDLDFSLSKGIPVFNAPFSNTRSVAELVLAEAILLMRGIPARNAAAHRGEWKKSAADANEIRGKTLGIIGYGNIGSQVSVLAESLGMNVQFADIRNRLPLGNAREIPLGELLETSDVVSLHVPQSDQTENLIGVTELSRLKSDAVLINASRGSVVDISALARALQANQIRGAAIDVFPREPKSQGEQFESELRGLDNVILTPHIGGSTVEAQQNIGREVANKFVMFSDNGTSMGAVNFPEVALPAQDGKHRLLHIHENRPGVLSAINQVLSENQINISGQFLQTNKQLGYVVLDVDSEYSELALEKLKQVDSTIRCRVLW